MNSALFSTASDNWQTPAALFQQLDAEFHFDLDAAACANTAMVGHYIGPDREDPALRDALSISWPAHRMAWLNPPYGQIAAFMKKASEEAPCVCLIPARTDTRWWWNYVLKAHEIRFLKGRLKFLSDGKELSSAPFPSAVVVFYSHLRASVQPYVYWSDWRCHSKTNSASATIS